MAKIKQPTPKQIKAARLERELTQTQAAELVHATLKSWQNWGGAKIPASVVGIVFLIRAKPKPNKTGRALAQQKNVGRALARQHL